VSRRVSVIVPARNEAAHIERCIRSVLEQRFEGTLEVIVADGESTDTTADLARGAGAIVIPNHAITAPAGLNAALAQATGDVVIRLDGHAEMRPGYIAACLRALEEEEGAVNVGGWCAVASAGAWGRALGAALASRFGVGNPVIWRAPRAGEGRRELDTVPFGCFPRAALVKAGGWSERFRRNEDFELNHRLRRAGGRVIFDPAVCAVYHPRESLGAVARQYWLYGRSKAQMLRMDPASLRPRQIAPLVLLGAITAAVTPTRAARPARAGLSLYALTLGGVALAARAGWRTAPMAATLHLAWGAGLVTGFLDRGRPRATAAHR
jgi:glycosyltransferase involved in cell wall biosynthesis